MAVFFIVILVLSLALGAGELLFLVLNGKSNFGETRQMWENTGKVLDFQDFLPKNYRLTAIFFIIFSLSGLVYTKMEASYLAIPVALSAAVAANIIIMRGVIPLYRRINRSSLPAGVAAEGKTAVVTEEIESDGFGKIVLEANGISYEVNAVSATDRAYSKGEKVIVVTDEQGVYFVEGESEIFNFLEPPEDEN